MVKEVANKKEKQPVANPAKPASGIWQDERFQHLVADPRFKTLPKQHRKVKIDKRFQGMFTNDKFKVKYTVDKYGRRVNKSNAEDLKKYYELDSSADESDEEHADNEIEDRDCADKKPDSSSSELDNEDEERQEEEKAILKQDSEFEENDALISDGEDVPKSLVERLTDPNIDYARGEGRLITDSSSDDESSEDEDPEMYIDHVWGELANDAESTDESTKRLAVCNMDWDRVRAVDLMVLFSSFLPPGGSVLSVKIYPSEFGKERLKEEELHGPPELVGLGKEAIKKNGRTRKRDGSDSSNESESDDDLIQEQDSDAGEGDDYHMEKLRQYQLNRLRYYYAVVECDSVTTADKIYQECDGIEYESSATKVDLRFIPDDTTFDGDEPSDVCLELPDANSYQPRQFTTTALQQAKVDLTWDETAVERKELGDKLSAGKVEGISDKELRKIVAYSSEEEQDDEEDDEQNKSETEEMPKDKKNKEATKSPQKNSQKKSKKKDEVINKYKALLAEINEKEEQEKQKKKYEMEFSWEIEKDKTNPFKDDKDIENDKKSKAELTPIEKVLQKRAEKNKKRKEERKKKRNPNEEDQDSDVDSIPDNVDLNDPYFAEEFANGDFEDPNLKRKEKQKKKNIIKAEQEEENEKQAKELELLIDNNAEEEGKQHFSLEKILKSEQETKSKKKRKKQLKKSKSAIGESQKPIEDNFKLDMSDQRFKAVFTSHEFNIDPTDPHFKKTKAMEQLIHEKLKRRHDHDETNVPTTDLEEGQVFKKPKKQLENTMLVKSLKRKIQMKQQRTC